jgi:DNA-binding CsgD family transcriptional regulator/PAS domain-containing protein
MTAQEVSADTIIALIYAAAHDPAKWHEVVRALRDHFRATQACFVRVGPNMTSIDQVRAKENPYFDELYIKEFANDVSFLTKILVQLPIGEVYSEYKHINPKVLREQRLWKEWLAPQDMYHPMGAKLFTDGISTWFVSIDRGQQEEAFQPDEITQLARLIPHFVNSIRMGLELATKRTPSATLSQVQLGVIVVDRDLRILFANEAAEQILGHAGTPLSRIGSGPLTTSDRNKAPELSQAVADAIAGNGDTPDASHLLLQSLAETDGRDVSVTVSSLGNKTDIFAHGRHAMLTVRELSREAPEDFDQQLRMLFGLSAQEARVAAKLAYGQTLKEVTESLEISMPTARTHLASLFRKTKTSQQSQLVGLLRASRN